MPISEATEEDLEGWRSEQWMVRMGLITRGSIAGRRRRNRLGAAWKNQELDLPLAVAQD